MKDVHTSKIYPNNTNTCAIVSAFNPSLKIFDVLNRLNGQFGLIIVIDDSSNDENAKTLIKQIKSMPGIQLIQKSVNGGIAAALNAGLSEANILGYLWAVLFDQDSLSAPNFLERLQSHLQQRIEIPLERLAVLGVKYGSKIDEKNGLCQSKESLSVITSGSLVNIAIAQRIGGFWDEMIIDGVDFEFCLRATKSGWLCLLLEEVLLIHDFGSPKSINWFGITIFSSNHSAIRRYFQARNHVWLIKAYGLDFPGWCLRKTLAFGLMCFRLVFADEQRMRKIFALVTGICHGVVDSKKPPTALKYHLK